LCTEKTAHKVRAKVIATIGTMDHDFALPNSDVCKQLGCPVKSNVRYTYHNSMFVSPTYPSVRHFFIELQQQKVFTAFFCLSLIV